MKKNQTSHTPQKNKNNKKAIVLGTLVILIIFLIGFVILLLWFSKSIGIFTTMSYDSKCALSLLNYRHLIGASLNTLDCNRNNIIVSEKKLNTIKLSSDLKNTDGTIKKIYSSITDDDKTIFYSRFFQIIADESLKCWKKFSNGQIDYFTGFNNILSGQDSCIVCSVIDIDTDIHTRITSYGISKSSDTTNFYFSEALKELKDKDGNTYLSQIEEENVYFNTNYLDIAPFSLEHPIYIIFSQHKENVVVSVGGTFNKYIILPIGEAVVSTIIKIKDAKEKNEYINAFNNILNKIDCDNLFNYISKDQNSFCNEYKKCLSDNLNQENLEEYNKCIKNLISDNEPTDDQKEVLKEIDNKISLIPSSSNKYEIYLLNSMRILRKNNGLFYSSIVVTNHNNVPAYCDKIFN